MIDRNLATGLWMEYAWLHSCWSKLITFALIDHVCTFASAFAFTFAFALTFAFAFAFAHLHLLITFAHLHICTFAQLHICICIFICICTFALIDHIRTHVGVN